GAKPGSRDPTQPGRAEHLGKHRLRLRELQRPQRRPDATAGSYELDPQAGEAEAEPGVEPEADPPKVPVLALLPGERLLVGGIEVAEEKLVFPAHGPRPVGFFISSAPRLPLPAAGSTGAPRG